MEDIYLKGNCSDWVTDKVSLKNYFDKFSAATKGVFCNKSNLLNDGTEEIDPDEKRISSFLGLPFTEEQLNKLVENLNKLETLLEEKDVVRKIFLTEYDRRRCRYILKRRLALLKSPDRLAVEGENPELNVDLLLNHSDLYEKSAIPCDIELETFKRLRNPIKAKEDCIPTKLKFRNQVCLNQEYNDVKKDAATDMNPGEHFIVVIRLYFPFESSSGEDGRKDACCSQEITVCGEDTLDSLKDVIICMEEFGDAAGDVSENPFAPVKTYLKEIYQSSMFYIGNTFYIDQRHPDNIDYSEVIRSWAAKRKINMKRVEKMENTKIKDLVIRFGYPYLYQHLGDCEHLVVFNDARLIQENDVCIRELYPKFTKLAHMLAKHCYMCQSNVAKWIVLGSERVNRDPIFVCNACFRLYFYKGNKKNGSFRAYHYIDRRSIL